MGTDYVKIRYSTKISTDWRNLIVPSRRKAMEKRSTGKKGLD